MARWSDYTAGQATRRPAWSRIETDSKWHVRVRSTVNGGEVWESDAVLTTTPDLRTTIH